MALKPRTATVLIYDGDDLERLGDLQAEVERRKQQRAEAALMGNARGGDTLPDVNEAQAALDAFIDEAAERATEVKLVALGRTAFRDLRDEHEPRMVKRIVDGEEQEIYHDEDGQPFLVNTRTFAPRLLAYANPDTGRATIESPQFSSRADLTAWLDELADGDFEKLWTTAFFLNTSVGADPKAFHSSSGTRTFGATSE